MSVENLAAIGSVVALVFGGGLWVANKIFRFGKISQRLEDVENDITEIKTDLKTVSQRIDQVVMLVGQKGLTDSHSPRRLTTEGEKALRDSGVDKIFDGLFDEFVQKVRESRPTNAYQVQQLLVDTARQLPITHLELKDALEEGAFKSGQILSVILFLGAIDIRDRVLSVIGMRPEDIDGHE